jgi:hypothetical protein
MKKKVYGEKLKIYSLSLLLLIVFSFLAYCFLINKTKAQGTTCDYNSASRKGYLESSTIDLGDFYTITQIMWKGILENNTFVGFQLAGSDSSSGPWEYSGPDGTSYTYFASSSPGILYSVTSTNLKNIQYLRYKVFLASCSENAIPQVNAVYIYYSK